MPVVPVFNYCTVNNMRFVAFLDTEEVVGSNPIVPTNYRFKDILDSPMRLDKPLINQWLLSFYVQRRTVEAMFPWGYIWGYQFQNLGVPEKSDPKLGVHAWR